MLTDKNNRFQKGFLSYLAAAVLFLLGWELLSRAIHSPLILPAPFSVIKRLVSLCKQSEFYQHIGMTMGRVFLSFSISLVCGIIIGTLCGRFQTIKAALSVVTTTVRSTPVVSFILLALLWLGASAVPVFVASLMTLPVILTAVSTAFSTIPRPLLDAAQVYELSPRQRFRHIVIPFLLPFLSEATSSCFGMAWKVVAAGEVLSLPKLGSGQLLYTAQVHLESADLLAVTLTIVLLSFSLEQVFSLLFRLLGKAHKQAQRKRVVQETLQVKKRQNEAPANTWHPVPVLIDRFSIARSGKELYRDFTLRIAPGSTTALLAPSGAGKTTLLNRIASLLSSKDDTFTGTVSFENEQEGQGAAIHQRTSFLFQDARLFPSCTVFENVRLPLLSLMPPQEASSLTVRMLEECGLSDKLAAFPDELSGGQRQRVALARAFAFPSPLMLLDEAFQSQDLSLKLSLIGLYERLLAQQPRTVIFVTHDIREALSCCSRIILLKGCPLYKKLDESLIPPVPDGTGQRDFASLYLNPDEKRLALERRITDILLEKD